MGSLGVLDPGRPGAVVRLAGSKIYGLGMIPEARIGV